MDPSKNGVQANKRSSSLSYISYKNEILPPIDDEKDAVEHMYHLQQSASDCNLSSLGAVQTGNLSNFRSIAGRRSLSPRCTIRRHSPMVVFEAEAICAMMQKR
jgi:hypothetical protein